MNVYTDIKSITALIAVGIFAASGCAKDAETPAQMSSNLPASPEIVPAIPAPQMPRFRAYANQIRYIYPQSPADVKAEIILMADIEAGEPRTPEQWESCFEPILADMDSPLISPSHMELILDNYADEDPGLASELSRFSASLYQRCHDHKAKVCGLSCELIAAGFGEYNRVRMIAAEVMPDPDQ